jgi:hypothetical protein
MTDGMRRSLLERMAQCGGTLPSSLTNIQSLLVDENKIARYIKISQMILHLLCTGRALCRYHNNQPQDYCPFAAAAVCVCAGAQALRCLALAYKPASKEMGHTLSPLDEAGLTFVAMVAMHDPPRRCVKMTLSRVCNGLPVVVLLYVSVLYCGRGGCGHAGHARTTKQVCDTSQ